MNLIDWLNNEAEEIVLQRDNAFAMLSWRDFNQPAETPFNLQTAAWLFLFATGIPLLMLS